jgi:multidrug resistance protein
MVPDFSEQRQETASSASSLSSSYHDGTEPVPIISEPSPELLNNTPTGASDLSQLSDKALQRPRNNRRGLLAQVTIIPEFYDARDYPMALKSVLVLVIGLAAMIGPMGTTIVFPAIDSMIEDFGTTTMMVNVSVGIYLLALGVFPLWWSSFSESLGRRTVYITSFTMYIGFAIGAALSPSINALIVFRVLTGACSASVQAVGAGTVSDLFPPEVRGRAMGYFYLGTLASPLVSPIIGSLLLIRWDWRSTQWFTMALAAVIDLCIILLLPETLREQNSKAVIAKILQQRRMNKEVDDGDEEQKIDNVDEQSVIDRVCTRISMRTEQAVNPETFCRVEAVDRERLMEVEEADERRLEIEVKESLKEVSKCKWSRFKRRFYEFVLRPLKAVYFLQYPPVALSISFSALTFSILYLMNMTLQYEFSRAPYNWRPLFVGFAYIPNSVSYIIASVYGGKWTDKLFQDYVKKHGFASAESRISYNMLSAVVCYPIALLIIGWCFQYHTFWVTPLIGSAIFGYATMMTIGPTMTYLVDSLPGRGATGIAVNNLCRQIGATAAVFLVDPMIKGMGTGPMCSMCAGLVILWSVVLLIMKKRGNYWRENYDLQALYDKLD